jgi:hypothetical protein
MILSENGLEHQNVLLVAMKATREIQEQSSTEEMIGVMLVAACIVQISPLSQMILPPDFLIRK